MCHRLANVVLVLITVVVLDDYGEGLAIILYSLVHVDACLQLHLVSFTLSTLFKAYKVLHIFIQDSQWHGVLQTGKTPTAEVKLS